MSEPTRIKELRKEIESLCGNCDRPDKEQLGEIILSSMALGFSAGLKAPSADRPQGEWETEYHGNGWNDYWDYTCSNCGKKYERADAVLYKANFCPHCGAQMKGADDEDNH